MKLLAAAGNIEALIAQIRLCTPLQALCEQQGWSLTLRSFHDCTRADLAAADVLVLQRGASARALALQRAMRQRGAAVIYEIDDLLTEISPHISNQASVRAQQGWLRRCMAQSDVVTVSTARLGHELGLPAALVVPNHALALGRDSPLPEQGPGRVSLLFASSDRLATEFIYPALRALQGDQVQVVVVGPPGQAFEAAGIAVQRYPLLPRERFVALARSLPNPLAVIPLEDSRFAACKSAVKWFDYAEAGVPALCSDVSPYAEVLDDGRTGGLVANDPIAWQAALQRAIADPQSRHRMAQAARDAVRQRHTLAHTVAAWQRAVEAAVQRRASTVLAPAALSWRVSEALTTVLEGSVLRLRRFNRARLARRAPR